jgi:hyperosmotically inducible protein
MTRTFASLVALVLLSGPAQASSRDFQTAHDVAAAVNRYANFTIFDDVSVEVREGVVTLNGKVTMPYKANDIAERVARVAGVKEVQNRLSVLPVSSWDDALRYQIARAIYGHSNFWNYATMANPPIHVIVEHGRVTLTGVVQNNVDRMLARALAANFNAFSVTNELKTDSEMRDIEQTN